MKKYILTTLVAISLSASVQAATIAIGAGFGATSGIIPQTNGGTLLTAGGYYIGVGVFGATPVINGPADLLAAVTTGFTEFGNATSATSGATQGKITASITAIPGTPATFNTKEIYLIVGNAATRALSTEFAILQGTPTWNFPADTAAGGATTLTVSSIASFNTIANAGTEVDLATDSVRLAVVPEPTSSVLGLLALGLLARRKR